MLLCNFNLNNLFVRYKFGKTFPGDIRQPEQRWTPDPQRSRRRPKAGRHAAEHSGKPLTRALRWNADLNPLAVDFQFERCADVSIARYSAISSCRRIARLK